MGRIRQAAHVQAKAEYAPQRARVRRETRSQVRSLRSEEPALVAAIELARKQLRHSGLSGRDLAIAESELAHRTMDVGAGTALQIGQARQDAAQQLVDLSEGQSQAERSVISQLQQAAQEHAQKIADEKAGEVRGFKMDLLKKQAEQALGLSGTSAGGLTPTQERAHSQSQHNAAFYAHQLVQASRNGVKDKEGNVVIPPGPHNWSDKTWNELVEKVASQKGVSSVTDAQRAVTSIRQHFQGGGNLMGALRTVAAATAPGVAALAPQGVQPILQAGMPLLRHR